MTPPDLMLRFTRDDAEAAAVAWGCNCGPAALAAMLNKTLNEVRPHIPDFDKKRFTNPTMMHVALRSLGADVQTGVAPPWGSEAFPSNGAGWPKDGLARIQWEGSWMNPGVPIPARYARTHWVGVRAIWSGAGMTQVSIFDINCLCVGGWVPLGEWSGQVVPWLWKELGIKATGWHVTHAIDILRRAA